MEYRRSAHSVYDLQYRVVFCTKYGYRVLCGDVAARCRDLIREICTSNYIDIISGNVSPDHVHLLMSIPPHISVSRSVQYMKGKSSRKLQQEFEKLRKRYWGPAYVGNRLLCSYDRNTQYGRCPKIYRTPGRTSQGR